MEKHILFFHSPKVGHLVCFCFGAIVTNVSRNLHVTFFVWPYVFMSVDFVRELLGITRALKITPCHPSLPKILMQLT